MTTKIFTPTELETALKSSTPTILEIQTSIILPKPLVLPEGFNLTGADKEGCILSFNNGDGIALVANNEVSNLIIQTNPGNRAIYVDSNLEDLGVLTLTNLTVTGQVQILTRENNMKTRLIADNIDIVSSDSRNRAEHPLQPTGQGTTMSIYQGAFTVYNYNSDTNSVINATLTHITLGRKNAPVIGSGLFLAGFGSDGGWVLADTITTGEIYNNGMIPFGHSDIITGGCFIVNGAKAKNITHYGSVTTYGVNDMVLDTWGQVESWTVEKPIVSYGPSGIGFVNFGIVDKFEAKDKIETFGLGARGFNQYTGTVKEAIFHSIITHGDGSIGIQVSTPVGTISVTNGVSTEGSQGHTLVKGIILDLAADAISVKPGGAIEQLNVSGGITTSGDNVTSYHVENGAVRELNVSGEILANGKNSTAVYVANHGQTPLANISAVSKQGVAVRLDIANITNRIGLQANGAKGNIIEN